MCPPRTFYRVMDVKQDRYSGVNLSVPIGIHCDMIEEEY
jgi:hypothetical protein